MRRGTGLFLLLVATALVALGTIHLPEALGEAELFRVTRVSLEGTRYLSEAEVLERAGIPSDATVWLDREAVALRLRGHPLVREARVRRRLPRTLVLEMVEREPVALLPTPALRPVDREGRLLPIDPALHRLDLPLLQLTEEGAARTLTPSQVRLLALELERLKGLDPSILALVSDAGIGHWGAVMLRLADPRVTIRYRPPLTPVRLRQGLLVLADAMDRYPDRRLETVDLRFADQVVVRFASSELP